MKQDRFSYAIHHLSTEQHSNTIDTVHFDFPFTSSHPVAEMSVFAIPRRSRPIFSTILPTQSIVKASKPLFKDQGSSNDTLINIGSRTQGSGHRATHARFRIVETDPRPQRFVMLTSIRICVLKMKAVQYNVLSWSVFLKSELW